MAPNNQTATVKNALLEHVEHAKIEHPELAPVFQEKTYEPIDRHKVDDRAAHADPTLKNLLANATVTHLAPKIGTELSGIQLHELTNQQRDELALLVAERGVVFLRDQDITIEQQLELGRHYGPLHVHQTNGHPNGLPQVHVIYNTTETSQKFLDSHLRDPYSTWHSDVSYEKQPPSYTSLKIITNPPVGGDTLWASGYEAYERLTPPFKAFVEGLTAIHSSKEQAENAAKRGLTVRRPIIQTAHPVVRTHPVTKRKALYVNPLFTRRIVELSVAESDAVLRFLYKHIAEGHEFQVRFQWTRNSIALWDNRVTIHLATFDYLPSNRHGVRVTPHGEVPFYEPNAEAKSA